MRDQRVRHRPLELEALRAARVAAFVLTAGQASAQQSADIISSKLQKIVNISKSEPRPFVYTLSAGAVNSMSLKSKGNSVYPPEELPVRGCLRPAIANRRV